ncbi:MFS transporter [Rhizobium sp. BK251]|uniref:MFS transporter n=1 Tax=Rhizobium sp. BK251 TaxID=2512125 RepID=UPI00104B386A|nr:MFS transporter [Rhizobium sp. BK251]TCL62948.1 putative MFS family arabinose efflux permease [Rhizobium sp. BK251]
MSESGSETVVADEVDLDASVAMPVTLPHVLSALSVGATAFLMVTCEFLPVGLLPGIAADLQITHGQAGLTVTIAGIMAAIGAPVVSVMAGTADRKKVLMFLSALLAISSLITALAWSFPIVLLGRVLVGFTIGGFWTVGVGIGPRLIPEPTGTRGTAIVFGGISLGTIAGVPVGTFVGDNMGWRWAFFAAAGLSLILLVAQMKLLPKLLVRQSTKWSDLPELLRIPNARLGLLLSIFTFGGHFFAYTYISPFLGSYTGMEMQSINALLLLYGVSGFFGNMIGSWGAGRNVRYSLVATSLIIAASVLMLTNWGSNSQAATAIVAIWGLGFGALPIITQTWMLRAAPEAVERGAALLVSSVEIAVAAGSLAGGSVIDNLGLVSTMAIGGLAVLAAAPLILIFRSTAHIK